MRSQHCVSCFSYCRLGSMSMSTVSLLLVSSIHSLSPPFPPHVRTLLAFFHKWRFDSLPPPPPSPQFDFFAEIPSFHTALHWLDIMTTDSSPVQWSPCPSRLRTVVKVFFFNNSDFASFFSPRRSTGLPPRADFETPKHKKKLQVSVDFGGLAPFSHNKICALSRGPLTRAVFRSGKTIVDHAANFLVSYDLKEDLKDGAGGGGSHGG